MALQKEDPVERHRITQQLNAPREGFSLIEALIAAALVLMITLGVMPLFTHAVVQNVSGKESTVSTNYSRSSTEELVALPLDRAALRPPAGQNSNELCQTYDPDSGWETVDPCPGPGAGFDPGPTWARRTFVQQYNINEIYDGDTADGQPTFKNPIVGYDVSSDRFDSFVHIRELMVVTEGQRREDSPLGKGRRVDMVDLRGF